MATKVPYEDVQTAATAIAQCATNALMVSVLLTPQTIRHCLTEGC